MASWAEKRKEGKGERILTCSVYLIVFIIVMTLAIAAKQVGLTITIFEDGSFIIGGCNPFSICGLGW